MQPEDNQPQERAEFPLHFEQDEPTLRRLPEHWKKLELTADIEHTRTAITDLTDWRAINRTLEVIVEQGKNFHADPPTGE